MKILIAVDGSQFSTAAVEEACKLILTRPGAFVRVVSAFDPTVTISSEPYVGSAVMYQMYSDGLKTLAEKAAADAARLIEKKCPDVCVDFEVIMGRPAETILDAGKAWRAELIVVGSHGHGFWGRAILGSVSNAILHHAHCPVLVVPLSDVQNGDNGRPPDRP